MEKNKRSFILKQIIWGIMFIAPSTYLIYRGVNGMNFLMILGGIVLFVIGIGIMRVALGVIRGAKLLLDDELDAKFADIHSYVSEILLPIGFEEENSDFYTTYKRGELVVQLSNDKRDQQFSLLIATKSKPMSMVYKKKKTTYNAPDFEISINSPFSNIEGFTSAVYEKLPDWLGEQNLK